MTKTNKTGGGPGTNQYKVRGQAKAVDNKRPEEVCGYPADQVIQRGDCVWLRETFDDIWCLKHRQLAPEVRQLMGLPPCATLLGPTRQLELVLCRPLHEVMPVLSQLHARVRRQVAQMAPPGSLQWAAQDPDVRVRLVAAKRMPAGQLQWVAQDDHPGLRLVAAQRTPSDQLAWAAKDPSGDVRAAAAERMPPDQLAWATTDRHWCVRLAAAKRMPPDQLAWATKDPDEDVRKTAAKRMPPKRR